MKKGPRPKTPETRFWSKVDRSGGPDACWPWTANRQRRSGYGQFWYERRVRLAHRVAWKLTRGEIPPGRCVLHRCDNPPCVNPAHLFLGTQADNLADMDRKGRRVNSPHPGERNGLAKLTEMRVRLIRHLRAKGSTQPALARAFNVTTSTVHDLETRRTWRHVA